MERNRLHSPAEANKSRKEFHQSSEHAPSFRRLKRTPTAPAFRSSISGSGFGFVQGLRRSVTTWGRMIYHHQIIVGKSSV